MKQTVINFEMENSGLTAEAFKSIRANIQFCGPDIHTIVITSCLPNDGKSTSSMGISVALAQAGKKVLLVDADLRKSVMLRRYSHEMDVVGFSELLSGQAELDDVVYKTQEENLHVIFSGQYPANPAELLSSSALKEFFEARKGEYDYILVDTPPLGMVVDAAVVANITDGAILVIPEGKIKSDMALSVKNQLEKSGAHIIGVVVNTVEKSKNLTKSYSGRYYSYGKYSSVYGEK